MTKKTVHLRFPPKHAQEPLIYKLVKDYDLVVNILRARIEPNETGHAIIEISGRRANINRAQEFIRKSGVQTATLSSEIRRHESRCTHCGACVAICPAGALAVEKATGHVIFQREKCVACQGCILACPFDVMELSI